MKIIISGYGRMGHEVEKAAKNLGHEISFKIDDTRGWHQLQKESISGDVIIDFSLPAIAVDNIMKSFELGLPIVTGTTGWYDKLDEITAACEKCSGSLLYAPNFSIGVNLFFDLNKKLAAVMSAFEEYRVSLKEIHHVHKLDAPSGTALKLAKDMIEVYPKIKSWSGHKTRDKDVLPVISERTGEVPGTHMVKYDSEADMIEIKHEAKNRSGFARGAVMAASWLNGKKGVFTMDDMLKSLL
jgi:4-hydroxy-tetrahydrodipicolinate reductase